MYVFQVLERSIQANVSIFVRLYQLYLLWLFQRTVSLFMLTMNLV